MRNTTQSASLILLALGLALPVAARSRPADPAPRSLTLSVRIFDYSSAPDAALAKARKEVDRIFQRAGIRIDWIECSPAEGRASDRRCTAKTRSDEIVMRVLPNEVVAAKDHSEFGVALVPPDGGFGKYAGVYFTRVEEYAERWQASVGLLLGHLIAHEMGHLLLGVNSHSGSGIMNVPWDRSKIERASLGTLLFMPREAATMQRQVAERIAAIANDTIADD